MQVLSEQNYFQKGHQVLHRGVTSFEATPQISTKNRQEIPQISQKKKPLNSRSKKNLTYDHRVEQSKQNNLKQKTFRQLEQLDRLNSGKQVFLTPFSSVCNTKGVNVELIKLQQKKYQSESMNSNKGHQQNSKRNPKDQEVRNSTGRTVQKLIEVKLNGAPQNKRKSISYRIHPAPVKQNTANFPTKKIENIKQVDKQEGIEFIEHNKEQRTIVRQKSSSQSFIIRKKINSNAFQSQRIDKKNDPLHQCVKKYRKDRFIKDQKSNHSQVKPSNFQQLDESNVQKSRLKRQENTKRQEQKERIRQKYVQKQIIVKQHQIKGIKCLKVRANKLIKAQQPNFFETNLNELQNKEISQKDHKQVQNAKSHQQDQKLHDIWLRTLNQGKINLDQAKSLKQNVDVKQKVQQRSAERNIQRKIHTITEAQQREPKPEPQNKTQKHLQHPIKQDLTINIKNRKNRISSIRAIKNYYKKLDTEEKSLLMDEKEIMTNKKKEKQASCLTHKIKWGQISKKRLNSERQGFDMDAPNFINEFSIQNQVPSMKKHDHTHSKETLQAKLLLPNKKPRPFNKIEFQEQKCMNLIVSPKYQKNQNLEQNFNKTIKSKNFIEMDCVPYHSGSKSLIIFEDPGISVIVNKNNSSHLSPSHKTIVKFEQDVRQNEFKGKNFELISPVPVMRKRQIGQQEQKCIQQVSNPLESLQQLFYELKSHKSIYLKANELELKVASLQELCQEQ